jgi:hypothetical protein
LRITFVLAGIGLSGGARVVFEYANRLGALGHEVTIVYPLLPLLLQNDFGIRSVLQDAGALKSAGRTNRVGWFDLRARIGRVPSLRPAHIRLTERFIPDADVVIATARETAVPVSLLGPEKGRKYHFVQQYEIWEVWDDEESWHRAEAIAGSRNGLSLAMQSITPGDEQLRRKKALVDATYRLPLKKITISSWLENLLESRFGQQVERTIVNGVNFETFYMASRQSSDRMRVLMPYRPYRNKGTQEGLKALVAVHEKYPETEIVTYGDRRGHDLPAWVEFYGNVTDEKLRALYNSADIFVSPSWTEGCQLPPMEAMACGCAVVSTNVGGVPDYAIEEETILACPPRDPDSLAEMILRLIEDPGLRRSIAENGHRHIQQFTWDRAVREFEDAILPHDHPDGVIVNAE